MTGQILLEALREGPKTTKELMASAGVSRNAVLCSLHGLYRGGYQIENDNARGGHRGGLYRLVYDRERPLERTCLWLCCSKKLNRYNPGPYCLHHRAQAARLISLCRAASLDRITEGPRHEPAALL